MDINEYMTANKKHDKDIVAVLRPHYPGVDRPLVVKVRNPDKYGIRFINDAEVRIMGHILETPLKPVRRDTHRLRSCLRCRVSGRKLDRVHMALKRCGYETIQSYMELVTDYALEHEEAILEYKKGRNI